jgi:hypothetical protein
MSLTKRIASVGLMVAFFAGAGSVLTAAPASALAKPDVSFFKPDICGDFCK